MVGAGFAGAVVARELAETGKFNIDVIDKRNHIAGNAYDEVDSQTGARYHKYGPHIFHTNDKRIFDYLSQFTEWIPYRHRVEAWVDGVGAVPMPINITTVNALYGLDIASARQYEEFLDTVRIPRDRPKNAREHLESLFGIELTELFFARYTQKMWALSLDEMPASVMARLPVRKDDNPYYFNDDYQAMPAKGYTALIANMLKHPAISVSLNTSYNKAMETSYVHIFNSMPIDEYFDGIYGELPYRSIKFEHRIDEAFAAEVPTLNFSDTGRYTRKTNWENYPGCGGGDRRFITYETPCDYKENNFERYYPVKTISGEPQEVYRKYRAEADKLDKTTFIGRCGQYIYYDMHQVVANSLEAVKKFHGY